MGKKTDTIIGGIVVLLLIITIYGFSQQYVEVKEQQDRLDNPPFDISAWNHDIEGHEISVEVLSVDNSTLFLTSYFVEPQNFVRSPVIVTNKGDYLVKITLDGNITKNVNVNLNEEKTLVIDLYSEGMDLGYEIPRFYPLFTLIQDITY